MLKQLHPSTRPTFTGLRPSPSLAQRPVCTAALDKHTDKQAATLAPPQPALRDRPAPSLRSGSATPAGVPRSAGGGPRRRPGYIELIIGPMFAGKTTRLMESIDEHIRDGASVLVVKSQTDTRSKIGHIQTHDGQKRECCAVQHLADVRKDERYKKSQVIAIDEAQFFPDLLASVRAMADEDKKHVFVAGLDADFQRAPFGQIVDLVPHSETVTKLQADCHLCSSNNKASFTQRTVNVPGQVLVGGADIYRSVCRHHFLNPDSTETAEAETVVASAKQV